MIHFDNIKKYSLNNGLQIILFQDKSFPLVSVNVWYKVGSANETIKKSGLAHLSEHLMFQGSLHVPKEAHFKHIEEAGGTLNGSTNKDRTNYYETLPSNHLELALWLESDRMGFLVDALDDEKFDNQLSVVTNERKERYDNEPYGRAYELIFSNIFPLTHPYHAPVIGWQNDLNNLTISDAKNFLKTFYSPNNASLVVAGDFNSNEAEQLINSYFGDFKSSVIEKPIFQKNELTENKTLVYYDKVNLPRIYLVWLTDKSFSDEDFALSLSAYIIGNSKQKYLYKKLVYDEQSAAGISCFANTYKEAGMFVITATAHENGELDKIKESIFEVIEEIKNKGFAEDELARFLTLYNSHTIFSFQNLSHIADSLNNYDFELGYPNGFNFELNNFRNLTTEKVNTHTKDCLSKPYFELRILPQKENNDN